MNPTRSIMQGLENKCRAKNIPYAVIFELTYHCNLSCKHCYILENNRRELSGEKVKGILDQLVDMGTFYLCFTGGEIFTRSDCLDILAYAKRKGFLIVILTNGTLIDQNIADFLKEIKPRGIEISLLGAVPETHDAITGMVGSFDKTVEAIKLLVAHGIKVTTKTSLMKSNIKEYKQIKALSENLGAVSKTGARILPQKNGGVGPQQLNICWEDRKRYLHDEALDESFITDFDEVHQGTLICKAGKMFASINPYGDVNPCILLPVDLGNLNEKSFRDIWYDRNNNTLNEIRNLKESHLEKCSICTLSSLCQRCAGAAYLETKNFRGPSSLACEEARWKNFILSKKQPIRT